MCVEFIDEKLRLQTYEKKKKKIRDKFSKMA